MQQLSFSETVIKLAKQIPKGKVATYGQIARLAGSPNASRAVGMIMSKNDSPKTMPCHRIVASNGKLTGYAFGGVNSKKNLLLSEGIFFLDEITVDLKKSQWNPEQS